MSILQQYPPELLSSISAHISAAAIPSPTSSLDPLTPGGCCTPASTIPPGTWSETVVRKTLANLCLVNHAWYEATKPWLWRRIEVRLPRSWMSLLDEVTEADDEQDAEEETTLAMTVQQSIQAATAALMALNPDQDTAMKLRESIMESLGGPDGSIPPDLLTPPASRNPSRLRNNSPPPWKVSRSISAAFENVMDHNEQGFYVPRPYDPRPGRFVRHLDFNHYRTIGMRRSIDEVVNSPFVTGERVEALLKALPNVVSFGATEYMDVALTLPVLNELFLRGVPAQGRGRITRGKGLVDLVSHDHEEQHLATRAECKYLQAIDLTGCISAVFVNALTAFVNACILSPGDSQSVASPPFSFPGLERLCLHSAKAIPPRILTPFVLAFPSLTHLDLSGTRATPDLLGALGTSSVRLRSLSLARCIRLTGECIKDFLVHAPAACQLQELTLYGDRTFPTSLTAEDLQEIFTCAPCFINGDLQYLDLSSAPITRHLLDVCKPQPKLRSLGLSYIPDLELNAVSQFIKTKTPNVEVLSLVSTSPELEWGRIGTGMDPPRRSARQASIALHTNLIRSLSTPPLCTKESLPPPTRLRVIELSMTMLAGLGAGAGSWRVVKSKGGRGWYVDTASGWVGGELKRDLKRDHPVRMWLERLADANGNVSSGVGWHSRKMEVMYGHGMLGREDGLYGAVSFAYHG